MRIIFVRHAEPDYKELEQAGYTDFGLELPHCLKEGGDRQKS